MGVVLGVGAGAGLGVGLGLGAGDGAGAVPDDVDVYAEGLMVFDVFEAIDVLLFVIAAAATGAVTI